jgi:hypothetical protein
MQVTEQNKQEAEKVVEMYRPHAHTWDCYWDEPLTDIHVINCAIQDRLSVLEEFKKIPYPSNYVGYKIQSLTEQIEYLKSKL